MPRLIEGLSKIFNLNLNKDSSPERTNQFEKDYQDFLKKVGVAFPEHQEMLELLKHRDPQGFLDLNKLLATTKIGELSAEQVEKITAGDNELRARIVKQNLAKLIVADQWPGLIDQLLAQVDQQNESS